jgi:hypothetical protein
MRKSFASTIIGTLVLTAIAVGEDQVVWQIGTKDRNFAEFVPVEHGNYRAQFDAGVNFTIGKSDAKKDFPRFQPGPEDWWAGKKQHSFNIHFDLKSTPKDLYVLRLDLVDTHDGRSPRLQITVNGEVSTERQLPRGVGHLALSRPDKGKAQVLEFLIAADLLKAKGNTIEIKSVAGSWTVYDALSLLHRDSDDLPAVAMTAEATIFHVEREGKLLQEILVQATGLVGDNNATVKLEAREGVDLIGSFDLGRPALGSINSAFQLPRMESARQLSLSLTCGKQTSATSLTQTPTRLWRIYCAPATHTDIGYTDIQDEVIELHNRNTDLALELIERYPDYHWNLESAWAAQMWLRDRPGWRHEEIYEASRKARLGIESSYLNMLTGLCSTEELIHNLYYSARLHREKGVPFKSHTLTDAPSHVWTLPTILANAGIKYLSVGVNQTRAPLFKKDIHKKSPFWWEGPDGSRILTWFTAGYSQAGHIGLKDGIDAMRIAIRANLRGWQQRGEDYPYDAILLHGAYTDNVYIGRGIAESITEYNKVYAYPKVVLCSNDVFFEYIEENFPDRIQVVRGCGGSYWEDGAGSSAMETGLNRLTHQDVVAAEAIWATAGALQGTTFPRDKFDDVWDNVLLYDEHTWGAHNSIRDPESDFVHRQWAVKAAYATDAHDQANRLIDNGLDELVARVKVADGSVLVFNPSGRVRTDVVTVKIPRGSIVMDGDNVVPQQIAHEDTALRDVTVAFVATKVPAVGYRSYQVLPEGPNPSNPQRFKDNVLENNFYRITFDSQAGAIASIIDKQLDKELVDAKSPYKLGQLIYAAGGVLKEGSTPINGPFPDQIEFKTSKGKSMNAAGSGPVYSSVKIAAELHQFQVAELETILHESQKRIDFKFRLNKHLTYDKEAVYIAFPIGGKNPQFRYEIGAGHVRPNEDQFPGACRDWFAVQRWVTVNTDDHAVAWSTVDAPLITLCDMTPGKWLDELPITNGTIFSYTMNNYWFTNYRAGQDGWFTFRYSLTSGKSIDPHAASLFGEQVQAPMRTTVAYPGREQTTLPSLHSFCSLGPDNIMLTTLKRADDGNGYIARMRELAGKDSSAVVSFALPGITSAARCDLVERDLGPLQIKQGKVEIPIKANSLATVRLK